MTIHCSFFPGNKFPLDFTTLLHTPNRPDGESLTIPRRGTPEIPGEVSIADGRVSREIDIRTVRRPKVVLDEFRPRRSRKREPLDSQILDLSAGTQL